MRFQALQFLQQQKDLAQLELCRCDSCVLLAVAPPACSIRIGPYDSGDPDVLEYHLLLMRYAGVDGVLIDWYGSHKVRDYGPNLDNSEALINKMEPIGACALNCARNVLLWCCDTGTWNDKGMQFGIVYEEYVCENVASDKHFSQIQAAQEDVAYMESNSR
eukprot:Skav202484  [mRNA]  locus=scaffold149:854483:855580:+ [translate_table: standard]